MLVVLLDWTFTSCSTIILGIQQQSTGLLSFYRRIHKFSLKTFQPNHSNSTLYCINTLPLGHKYT
jgi:hypothetical protein